MGKSTDVDGEDTCNINGYAMVDGVCLSVSGRLDQKSVIDNSYRGSLVMCILIVQILECLIIG